MTAPVPPLLPADRVITVAGSHNLRDLGGLVTGDGHVVRRGRIYRSDFPGFANDAEGSATVRTIGLAAVVDLRRGNEAAAESVTWDDHGVTYVRVPLMADGVDSWHAGYQAYLTGSPDAVVTAVRHLMTPAEQPALFHCAAGKDRTGTIAALLLKVLDVPDEVVVADYVLTQDALEPMMARLLAIPVYAEMLADSSIDKQTPRAANMVGFLAWLDDQGGAEAWLLAHGLTADEVAAYREAMLEPTAG